MKQPVISRPKEGSLLSIPSEQEALELHRDEDLFPVVHRAATATSLSHRGRITLLWRRHISLAVPHNACRDHLGRLTSVSSHTQSLRNARCFPLRFQMKLLMS